MNLKLIDGVRRSLLAMLCLGGSLTWAQGPPLRVAVSEFKVSGNSLLPQARLDAALQPFLGERSLDELKQAALAVQDLYRQAGYGGVIAYLPEQSGPAGVASIKVLEGRITRVNISGNQVFSSANIRRSLPLLAPGLTPQVVLIDAQIQLANENPAKQVAVSLEAGQHPGEVDVQVSVSERPARHWSVGLDNTGNASTGRLRSNVSMVQADLWDLDHVLSLQFQFAPEKPRAVAVASVSYRVPFYAQGLILDGFLARSNVDGGSASTAAGPLQFSGRGEIAAARLTQHLPRQGEVDQRLVLGLDQRIYINDCRISGLPAGACGSAGESVVVHPLSLEYQAQRGGENPLGLNFSAVHNLALGGRYGSAAQFEAVRAGATRHYLSLRMNGFGGLALPSGWQLQGRLNGQYSPDALVSGEQLGLGGASSVRGYEEREIVGDSGFFAALELHGPDVAKRLSGIFGARSLGTTEATQAAAGTASAAPAFDLRLLAFTDAGRVSNQGGLPCREAQTRCSLASFGLGARLSAGPLQVRLDVAQALRAGQRTAANDLTLHFMANYSFL